MPSDQICGANVEERVVGDAPGAAADLAQDDRDSTWVDIVSRHATEIPRWSFEPSAETKAISQRR